MRWIVIIGLLAACGCGGKKGAAASKPPETSTGPGAGGLLACQSTVRAMDAYVACAPNEDEKLVAEHFQRSMREVITSTKPIGKDTARLTARMCLGFLEGVALDLASKKCSFSLTKDEGAWLDAEHGRRTPIPAEAKGADRTALEKVAALRDRACACTDTVCVDGVEGDIETSITPLSNDATRALADVAGEMIDELGACGRRVRLRAGIAEPDGPDDPAAIRALAAQIRAARAAEAEKANRPPPPPVMLPDGKMLKLADCAPIVDEVDRDMCMTLFDDVAECQSRGAEAKACVDELVNEYVGGGFEDAEDDEEGSSE